MVSLSYKWFAFTPKCENALKGMVEIIFGFICFEKLENIPEIDSSSKLNL